MAELTPQAREDIQGFILSGYGHLYYTTYHFLQIQNPTLAKTWLKSLIPQITTGKRWTENSDGSKEKPEITLNIAFTYPGFKTLGLPQHTLDTFSREFIEGITAAFRSQLLGDTAESAPEYWEIGGTNTPEIHLVLILNGSSSQLLQEKREQLLQTSETGIIVITEEAGFREPNDKEHFGFRDSISQPKIEGNYSNPIPDIQLVSTGELILGYPNQYGILPATPVVPLEEDKNNFLPRFPGSELPQFKDFGYHGTYLVYRKLAQDVAKFWQFMVEQGQDLDGHPQPEISKLLASKCVGRWPSGTPLVLSPEQDNPQIEDKNQFLYVPHDSEGFACPVGAHIRRTNPRDAFLEISPSESVSVSNRHRILRRGTFFGEPLFPLDKIENSQIPLNIQDDGKPRGLHFFCLNVDIGRQFEFVQQSWVNNPKFNRLYDNKDPIIGDNNGESNMEIPRQPVRKQMLNLPRFVTVKGGSYLFLPSLTAIKFLCRLE